MIPIPRCVPTPPFIFCEAIDTAMIVNIIEAKGKSTFWNF